MCEKVLLISLPVQEFGNVSHKMKDMLPSTKRSLQVISDGLPHLSTAESEHFVSISQNANIDARGRVSVYRL